MKILSGIVRCLLENGFEEALYFKNSHVFTLKDDPALDLLPFFTPHILKYDNGRAVAGILGSIINPATDRSVNKIYTEEKYVVTCYSANFPSLRSPPIFGHNTLDDVEWCSRIAHLLRMFPKRMTELISLRQNVADIGGVYVNSMNIF